LYQSWLSKHHEFDTKSVDTTPQAIGPARRDISCGLTLPNSTKDLLTCHFRFPFDPFRHAAPESPSHNLTKSFPRTGSSPRIEGGQPSPEGPEVHSFVVDSLSGELCGKTSSAGLDPAKLTTTCSKAWAGVRGRLLG
jgi:hypothetical protein